MIYLVKTTIMAFPAVLPWPSVSRRRSEEVLYAGYHPKPRVKLVSDYVLSPSLPIRLLQACVGAAAGVAAAAWALVWILMISLLIFSVFSWISLI